MQTDVDVELESERERVEAWRPHVLLELGFNLPQALALAANFDVDVHEAEALIRAGCPRELARRILE